MNFLKIFIFTLTLSAFAEDKIDFNQDIRPIFSDKCFHCHGPDAHDRKGKLRLDITEGIDGAFREKKGKFALKPGDLAKSEVWERIISSDPDESMPPPDSNKKPLTDKEKELVKKWILQGATYQKHWSFAPVKNVEVPKSSLNEKDNEIDVIVKSKLKDKKLTPSPMADKRTLIRRLSFDLRGLPPALEEITAFLNDESPDAYEKLVDNYLKSPQYGEHMARYWLDVSRYGDTHGLHGDNYREMYLYRDWVIKAFNNNMPFNQFTVEQVAGDLLPNPSPEQLIASGFNRLHISNSAGDSLEEELYVNEVKDRVNSTGTIFLALTLGCTACHDHKYDPISQKEYYQLFAFFNNIDGSSDNEGKKTPAPFLVLPSAEQKEKIAKLEKLIKSEKDNNQKKKFAAELEKIKDEVPATLIMKERKDNRPAYILNRGEYNLPGEEVFRQTPQFLPAMQKDLPLNRLGFAKWLISEEHPLTSRVFVNRLWQQFFGIGIVKTSEDFGSQGEPPSHPELLDYLASNFMKNNWDVKKLVKKIVMSSTYRQTSAAANEKYLADPENRFLTRGPRYRMDAEMLRDQALFISGLLSTKMYGKSVKPPQPPGLWQSVGLYGSNTRIYTEDQGENIYRRSLYTFWKRTLPPPAMTTFNAPSRETCTARRERTNSPLQALVLMNEEQFFESCIALAKLTIEKDPAEKNRINFIYEKMTGQLPDQNELELISRYLKEFKQFYAGNESPSLQGKKLTPEIAAWTLLANSLMSLDKFKSKE